MTRATEPTFNGPAGSTKTIRMLAPAVESIFIWEEGSSATDSVTDVTDVKDRRKKEEGRRKTEEGRPKK